MKETAEDRARRELDEHALRLMKELEGQRGSSARLEGLFSLAESRGVPISEVIEAAEAGELRSIVALPDRRAVLRAARARKVRLEAMRRGWS